MLSNVIAAGKLIQIGKSKIQCLLFKFKGLVYVNKPIHKYLSHICSYIVHEFCFLFVLYRNRITWMLIMKFKISAQYYTIGSRAQQCIFLSNDLDLVLFSEMSAGFQEIELFFALLDSMFVMSLPKTLLLIGIFLILQSIVILAN